jgi:hypothetical protein
MLAFLFAGITLFATANSGLKTQSGKTIVKKVKGKTIVWEIRFSCNGTPGTFCCFNSEGEAQSFINNHSSSWFCDYVNQP